jgi:hypothetical protein
MQRPTESRSESNWDATRAHVQTSSNGNQGSDQTGTNNGLETYIQEPGKEAEMRHGTRPKMMIARL